jgi:hypothetical protein
MYDIIKIIINLNPPRKSFLPLPCYVDKLENTSFVGI